MNIVVTGSLGNISRPLAKELVQQGHAVTIVSSQPARQPAIEALGATAAIGSIEDLPFLTATFTGAEAVYCMVPPGDYTDPTLDLMRAAHQQGTTYVEAIRRSGVKRVVHLSSVGAHLAQGSGLLRFHHLMETILRELPADVALTHLRPVGFYTNLYGFTDLIRGRGMIARLLTLRFSGLGALLKGQTGIIVSNYGGADKTVWVAPTDIAAAAAEELTTPLLGRKVRYVASEELTCQEVATSLGTAIGKPYLKWGIISDKQLQSGLQSFGMAPLIAAGMVEMQAAVHTGLVDADYYRNRPKVLGNVKMTDFAQEFAAVYHQQ